VLWYKQEEKEQQVLDALLAMPPDAFERLSQRLLRECGFTQVEVTGHAGGGGIDGKGVLRLGGLINFQVVFQRKRNAGTAHQPLTSSTAKNWQTCSKGTNWVYKRLWWKRSKSMRRGSRPSDQKAKLPSAAREAQGSGHTAPNPAPDCVKSRFFENAV
jgi:hypothetical protein